MVIDNKFNVITVEPDTTMKSRNQILFCGHDAVYETWSWDGVDGASVIFLTKELKLSPDELESKIMDSIYYDSKLDAGVTISETAGGCTFVNFNFFME